MLLKRKVLRSRARRDIGSVVDILIELLDSLDDDPDLEPDEDLEDDGDQDIAETPRRDRVPPRWIKRRSSPT